MKLMSHTVRTLIFPLKSENKTEKPALENSCLQWTATRCSQAQTLDVEHCTELHLYTVQKAKM